MNKRTLLTLPLLAALAACQAPLPETPTPDLDRAEFEKQRYAGPDVGVDLPPDGQVYPDGNTYRLQAIEELPILRAGADAENATWPAARLIDGNLTTAWASVAYRAPTAWASVELAATTTLASIGIKSQPSKPGTGYDIQVSSNGTTWTTALAHQTSTTWGIETKRLPTGTTGKFVRILWHNSPTNSEPRVAIYELSVQGEPTGTPPVPQPSSAPTAPPVVSPPPGPPPGPTPAGAPLTVVSATASSIYVDWPASRTVDGDQATWWASGGYKQPEEWLMFDLGSAKTIAQLKLKAGAMPSGVTYKLEISNDQTNWQPASGRLNNTTWALESKEVFGTGRYLRIRFLNSLTAPIARFIVYEAQLFGPGGTTVPTPAPTTPPRPAPDPGGTFSQFYPDWLAVPASNAYIERTSAGKLNLRFNTALANVGSGPLQIRGRVDGHITRATQEIVDSQGRVVQTHDAGTFEYHASHGHFHVTGMARYELRQDSPTGPLLRTAAKVSFCVEDSYKFLATSQAAQYPDCTPTLMGITRNYADLYSAGLPGQEFDITGLPGGQYYILIYVDPFNKFLDASRANNTSWAKFQVNPGSGTAFRIEASM